ncbi:MAG: HAD family hydrolase [Chitinispirillaceae bacterium]
MSELAEYAQRLHSKESQIHKREFKPLSCVSSAEELKGIRAVICDIYGTMLDYWRPGFENRDSREQVLLEAFGELAGRFGMTETLEKMNPKESAQETLSGFYHGLIAISHEKAVKKGIQFPEVKIEEVWALIVMMLKRNGYEAENFFTGSISEFPRYLAFTYNFLCLGRQLYPGVIRALEQLKEKNITVGILSNAQFYTPMDLTLLVRDQSEGKYDDYNELFNIDLTIFSYDYGYSKPNQLLFRKLYDALYQYQILPSQTVFVGNDLSIDIQPAAAAGMKTAFFTGDDFVAFEHDLRGKVVPDICFESWGELVEKISFHGEEE